MAAEVVVAAMWRYEPMDASHICVFDLIGTFVTELDPWVRIRAATDQVTAAATQRHEPSCELTKVCAWLRCCVLTGGFGAGYMYRESSKRVT